MVRQKNIKPESKESDELEVLSILIKEYELEHYPVPKPSPLEAIKFRIEQMGMSEAELSNKNLKAGITDLINIFWLSIYLFTFKTHLKRSYGRFIQSFEYYTHRIVAASFT